MSNLQLRIISALVLAAIALGLTWLGGLPFRLLCAGMAAVIFYEWARMSRPLRPVRHSASCRKRCFVRFRRRLDCRRCRHRGCCSCRWPWLSSLRSRARHARSRRNGMPPALPMPALSGLSLALLRDGDHAGLVAILFLFAVVWATDIFAYFVGRAVGGPKLAPSISPGKTQSGALGGAVGGVVAGAASGRCCRGRQSCRARRWSRWCCRSSRRLATCSNPGSSAATASRIRARSFRAMAASWTGSTGLSRRLLPYTSSAGFRRAPTIRRRGCFPA